MNLAAFAPAEPKEQQAATLLNPNAFLSADAAPPIDPSFFLSIDTALPDDPSEDVFDQNGLWVPHFWRANVKAWEKLALCVREKMSADRHEQHLEALAKEAAKKPRQQRNYAPRFSTDYAIKWGRKQGWKLVERESYDHLNKRHHDCMFGMDAIMAMPTGQLVGVQGAGRSERKAHRQRFDNYGLSGTKGEALAKVRNIAIFYVEFNRGDFEPVLVERWA